jgi:hypothetical protein
MQRWAMGWMIGGSSPDRGWKFLSSPPRPDRLPWGPPSLLSNGYYSFFPWGWSGRDVKQTTHFHLVPRSKNAWSYTSTHPNVFMVWCSVKKKHRDNFTLYSHKNVELQWHLKFSDLPLVSSYRATTQTDWTLTISNICKGLWQRSIHYTNIILGKFP